MLTNVQGCAVVLQGRYIAHQALRAFGNTERITSVTSLRPKDYAVKDDTVLKTVRPVSDLSELYGQFTEYRLDILENRIKEKLDKLREEMRSDKRFDTNSMKKFLQEQEEFLSHMIKEMVDDELVIPGMPI